MAGSGAPATPQFCLARPVHPAAAGAAGRGAPSGQHSDGVHGGELELVWPMPLDASVMDAVRGACAIKSHAKRKVEDWGEGEPVLSSVNHKLRKLCV
jgi:hypothetical protein